MTIDWGAASLLGLDAIVIDTETTGLDPRKARIVEVAAVRLIAGRLDERSSMRRLINPGTNIPAEAIRIHGIDDAAVADAPLFESVWPELSAFLGNGLLIGHTLTFDLALLRRECERIGESFETPNSLDIRLLAEIAEPDLADFSLESLAAWLGVEIKGRHSAWGDAVATGNIFSALIPRLRDRGIRTFAEARYASAALADASNVQRLGPADATMPTPQQRAEHHRVDVQPYSERVGSIMTAPPRILEPGTMIGTALETMAQKRISSVFVFSGQGPVRPGQAGILTERDVLRALSTHGAEALKMPVDSAMSRPLLAVSSDALIHVAIGRMNRLRIRHLAVTDPMGHVVGAISARDLLRLRAEPAVELGDEINQANDIHELARAWSKLPRVAGALLREGLSARQIAAVISNQCADLTRRAAEMSENLMQAEGKGGPPTAYALLVLGSVGRDESLLAMDQDNALVFADDAPEGSDRWFEELASRVADILHAVGVPYCKGGVMAKNPPWRGSVAVWHERIERWMRRSQPQDLLSVDIFFDLRAVHGQAGLAEDLRTFAFDAARGQAAFAKLLIDASGSVEPALNWYGGLRTADGRIDLKKGGLFGIVRGARALAVSHHVMDRSTLSRIEGIKALHTGSDSDLDALADAQDVFLSLILGQQIVDIGRGRSPDNSVELRRLSRRERERLRTALKAVEHLDDMIQPLLFGS